MSWHFVIIPRTLSLPSTKPVFRHIYPPDRGRLAKKANLVLDDSFQCVNRKSNRFAPSSFELCTYSTCSSPVNFFHAASLLAFFAT